MVKKTSTVVAVRHKAIAKVTTAENVGKNFTKNGIIRLARRAGAQFISRDAIGDTRETLVKMTAKVVRDAVLFAENDKRVTIQEKDILRSLEFNNLKTY